MKFLLTVLSLFLLLPFAAFSDVTGTWAYSGVGCRDASLSADSHDSRSKEDARDGIQASVLKLNSDGSASMMIEMGGEVRNEKGSYEETGDIVKIFDQKDESRSVLTFNIVGDELILDETQSGDSNASCEDGDHFVYVFKQV